MTEAMDKGGREALLSPIVRETKHRATQTKWLHCSRFSQELAHRQILGPEELVSLSSICITKGSMWGNETIMYLYPWYAPSFLLICHQYVHFVLCCN